MRLKRTIVVVVVSGLVAIAANAAMAQSLEGGCTVSATSDLDSTIMTDATRSNPFDIDAEGSISWNATSPEAIMNHNWVINVDIGGFAVPVAKGGDPNTAGVISSVDSKSIPELVQRAKDQGTAGADLLLGLRGIYRVFGNITGTSSCFGDAYVNVKGSPLTELPGQVAAAVAVLGLILTMLSGMAKKE
jgi:hypothetical protein